MRQYADDVGNLLFEAAWRASEHTQAQLAAVVCDEVELSTGHRPGIDERAIRRLIEGDTRWPIAQTRDALRKVLGVGSDADLGLYPDRARPGAKRNHLIAQVAELGRCDVERRDFMVSSAAAIGALVTPAHVDELIRPTSRTGVVHVGEGEVRAVQEMTRIFGDAGSELGGGHARMLVARYLSEDVQPWLYGTCKASTKRDMLAAVARLVHLAGWMAADAGHDDFARGYYTLSCKLAGSAKDAEAEATALRGLAVHAISLGPEGASAAKDYATAALKAGRALDDPRAVAYYQTTMAESAALGGDRHAALSALTAAESAIGHAPAVAGEAWSSHFSPGRWAHATGMILARLGETGAAMVHQQHALNVYGIDRRRSRAHVLAAMGDIQLSAGDVAGSFESYGRFITEAHGVKSANVTKAVERIKMLPIRFPGASEAVSLAHRAQAIPTEIPT